MEIWTWVYEEKIVNNENKKVLQLLFIFFKGHNGKEENQRICCITIKIYV